MRQQLNERFLWIRRNLRQPCCAQCWPHIPPRTVIELLTADIRQHLTPVLTTRPATNQRNTLRFNAAGMHDIHAICQRITHAFQHCSRQFIGAMLMSQTKENPLRLGIIVWCTLAGKIRQKPNWLDTFISLLSCSD
ncbi:Uncharacterised protein [Shigella sonnei]|nr:Uncharacterised protein [Shigella sonnei]